MLYVVSAGRAVCWNVAVGWTRLFALVVEGYLHGVSTRKVDDLVKALGADTGMYVMVRHGA